MSIYTINYEGEIKSFKYDREKALVLHVVKATDEDHETNEEWIVKRGKPLFEIQNDGYMVVDSVGLSRENWDNKEARQEYLYGWFMDMREEMSYLMAGLAEEFGLEM